MWGGFLIRRSSAIRRFFTGFLRCDSRTMMKSFLIKIARKFTGNLHKNLTKFPENSRSIFFEKRLHYGTTIAPPKSCEKPANRRAASDEKPTHAIFLGSMSIYLLIIKHIILYYGVAITQEPFRHIKDTDVDFKNDCISTVAYIRYKY